MIGSIESGRVVDEAAHAILNAFDSYHNAFHAITVRAHDRFERQDWAGMQSDMVERLDVYMVHIYHSIDSLHRILGPQLRYKPYWIEMKRRYSKLIAGRDDFELAETFFNSTTRRIFVTVGVDPQIEYVDSDFENLPGQSRRPIYRTYHAGGSTAGLVRSILDDYAFAVPYEDLDRDVQLAAGRIEAFLDGMEPRLQIESVHVLEPVFFRNKGAHLIGSISLGAKGIPLLLGLRNEGRGVRVDAVLLTEDDVSIVFSFTRSYFHAQTDCPSQVIQFLKTIMPRKRVAELYISLGYNKHGKTELYRDLLHHLRSSSEQFEITRGEKGMVMIVFTMPSFDVVFKVIRDRFAEPKMTSHAEVKNRYQLVFKHDRAGRLVDAQEFEHLRFERSRFSQAVLAELVTNASSSVTLDGETVAIKHLYIERRLTPLDVYLRESDEAAACEAAFDYGMAIKDLAATNIFPGDILLKNFGVTRHGRVVFYDYDELCLLVECNFRTLPRAHSSYDEFSAEPSFYVGKNDIFPEEFVTFLGLQGATREAFLQAHADLFQAQFWRRMQARHQSGEVIDIYPYKQSLRLENVQDTFDERPLA